MKRTAVRRGRRRLTAKEWDEETGLYYFGARYYDPRTSVWQSPDPILGELLNGKGNDGVYNPRNLGLYSYAYQNPIRLVDPDGNNPGPVYVPGVFGMVDYKTGNAIADNTVLAVGNTALNITNSVANVALKAFGAVGDALPDPGVIQSAGMPLGPQGVMAAGAGSFVVRGLAAISRADRAGAGAVLLTKEVELTAAQLKNVERFKQKLPANAKDSLTLKSIPNEGIAAQATSLGRVPGSSAVYEKQIDALGKTSQYTKTTYDPAGNIVHVKDKIGGGEFP